MKTGAHPFVSKLKLFFKWGISFPAKDYEVADKGARRVSYVSRERLIMTIMENCHQIDKVSADVPFNMDAMQKPLPEKKSKKNAVPIRTE